MCVCYSFIKLIPFDHISHLNVQHGLSFPQNITAKRRAHRDVLTGAKNEKNPTRGNNFFFFNPFSYSFMTSTCEHKLGLNRTQRTARVVCGCKTAGMTALLEESGGEKLGTCSTVVIQRAREEGRSEICESTLEKRQEKEGREGGRITEIRSAPFSQTL